MSKIDNYATSIGKWAIKWRVLVMTAVLFSVISMASGGRFIVFDTSYRVFFSKENPQLKAFDQLQRVYTKTDNIVFALKPKNGDVFNRDVLSAVSEITEEAWKLPFAGRVDSITNYQHTSAIGDELTVASLVEGDPQNLTDEDLKNIRNIVMSEPLLVHSAISENALTTGVSVIFNFPEKDMDEIPRASTAAQDLLKKINAKYPDIEMVASGVVSMGNAFSDASMHDMQTLIPIMYAVLLLTMMLFLRSIFATIATLLVIAFSAAAAMGLAGWAGIHLTPPSATAPTIILTLAIADSIHIIVSMLKAMQNGMDKRSAIIESLRINLQPVFLTSLTTAIGFLALNFSDAPPFRDLGNITAVGVIFAFIFSIVFLPAVLSILPISCKFSKPKGERKEPMDRLGDFVVKRRKALFISISIIIISLAFSIPRLEANDQWMKYFDKSMQFRTDTEFLIENLTGIYRMEYSIDSGAHGGVSDPDYLQKLESFTKWLRAQPEVVHVYSLTDIFKRLNRNMHGDDPEWHKIPDSRELAAQYLLLYEFSLPYGLDLTDRINIDKSATRVSIIMDGDISTRDIRSFKDKSEQWLQDNTPKPMHTEATSPSIMFAYIAERNINGMMKGNILALFLISLIIMIALKSFKMGIFSLIPNIVPPIMGFGVWALLIGEVNMAVALVTSISLGIIVDDTIHFLSKYYRAIKEKNLSSQDAVRYAFSTVGSALTVTSFVLILGFAVLVFSAFKMNSLMGMLTAIIILCALIADFFLLPPLLMMLEKKKKR